MSEQKAPYHTSNTRACFNCESGTMTRTDHPEPGWYCKVCDTFLPDDQDRPELEPVITQVIRFGDGSRLTVKVEAPRRLEVPEGVPGERGPGLLAADLATRNYYAYIRERLDLIEKMARDTSLSAKSDGAEGLNKAGERFTLDLGRLELISLNRGLNCWLAELRMKKSQATPGEELEQTIDQTMAIAAEVCRRIDTMLGIR